MRFEESDHGFDGGFGLCFRQADFLRDKLDQFIQWYHPLSSLM